MGGAVFSEAHVMKIVIKKEGKRYVAYLYIDEELVQTSAEELRPGCAVRSVINWSVYQYGAPDEMELMVEGW